MELKDIEKIVTHNNAVKYRVVTANGKKKTIRLFKTSNGLIGRLPKGYKVHGYILDYYDYSTWVSLVKVGSRPTDRVKLMKKHAIDALRYLNESGMWPSIKKEIEYFLSDDKIIEDVCKAIETDSYNNFYKECYDNGKFPWCHTFQVFESLYSKRCWKSIPYSSSHMREYKNQILSEAIRERKECSYSWHYFLDNRIEVTYNEKTNEMLGWLSCEYTGCANGHYYLLFDATHAIFYEND